MESLVGVNNDDPVGHDTYDDGAGANGNSVNEVARDKDATGTGTTPGGTEVENHGQAVSTTARRATITRRRSRKTAGGRRPRAERTAGETARLKAGKSRLV